MNSLITVNNLSALRQQLAVWRKQGLRIGFVPTMGNLHQGHLSLVEAAQQHVDKVVVSIFVNPLQFGENEDFDDYPRTFEADQAQLEHIGADMVFYPSVDEIYPNGLSQTLVSVPEALTNFWEGALRPGHFTGVTTIVSKLFNMVQPDLAVFGQKDFQQCAVIQRMVEDLSMPIELLIAPIQRDHDGLALSSRNQYLNPEQRQIAPKLYQTLSSVATEIRRSPADFESILSQGVERLTQAGFDQIDYLTLCDASSLQAISSLDANFFSSARQGADTHQKFVLLVVARLGTTRLLDNYLL